MMPKKPPSTYCSKKVLNIEIVLNSRYNVLEKIG